MKMGFVVALSLAVALLTGAAPLHAKPSAANGASPTSVAALPAPPSGTWHFKIYFGDYTTGIEVASLDYIIRVDGGHYRLATEGRASGLVALFYSGVLTQTSEGRLTAAGLEPEHYSEKRGKRPERSLRVDRQSGQVIFKRKPARKLVPGTQDRLSVLVQLGLLARAQPGRFAPNAVISLPELSIGDLQIASYTVRGVQNLPTPRGPLRALHLERPAPQKDGANRIEAWLGYDQQLLPVRIRITEPDGRVFDQMLALD
ncbi:MAG: DUF3108 domain-containing protein, partial [Quisquiliibacterium sp.]